MSLFVSRKPTMPEPPAAGQAGLLTELVPGADLASFFRQATGCKPDANYFGVYAVEADGDQLYLGLGAARPAEANGALLARTDGQKLTAIGALPEQGFVEMRWAGNRLYIPGADPTEDWTMGNTYVFTPGGGLLKHRNMPNVVHTWGIYPHAAAGRLYASVGQHTGDNMTFLGGVFISEDEGQSWMPVEDPREELGSYRTYDIAGFRGDLYALVCDDYGRPSVLARSSDQGLTWKRVNVHVEGRPRLLATRSYLVAQKWGRDGLALVSPDGKVDRTRFRDFLAPEWAYNYITPGYGGWYYLLADGGRIYNSRDLVNWTLVTETGLNLLAIGYWQTRNWLIVADRGTNAGLWYLDLAAFGAI